MSTELIRVETAFKEEELDEVSGHNYTERIKNWSEQQDNTENTADVNDLLTRMEEAVNNLSTGTVDYGQIEEIVEDVVERKLDGVAR